ncbi:MAG: adenosine deaminase [Chloroflexota bacterium]
MMDNQEMATFIANMPKAELHLHIEGTLSPQTLLKLSARNNHSFPYPSVEAIEHALANRPAGLNGFLDHHYIAVATMQTELDFYDATADFLKTCRGNHIVYVEMFFDPQFHTSRGISFEAQFNGIQRACSEGKQMFGVESNLIMCINRERSVESAFEMLEQARPYRDKIIGLGMDSYEELNFPHKFKDVFKQAKKDGYRLTSHCDVDVPNSINHIWDCLNLLEVERIDHGLMAVDDPKLIEMLIARNITLTTCPVRRPTDSAPQDIERIKFLFEQGVKVTINTDDPAEFETGYLTNMLQEVQAASQYDKKDIVQLMLNAFEGSWLPSQVKKQYIEQLYDYSASSGVL